MIGVFPQEFTKLIPLRFVDLDPVALGRHLVRFGSESEVRRLAVECRQFTSRGYLDCAVEFLWLEQFGP